MSLWLGATARYSFKKLTASTRLPQHHLPEEPPHAEHDVADLDTLPNPFNPLHLDTVAWNADHIELEKPGRNAARMRVQETGEPMKEGVVATVADGEDEQEFGGISDRYTSVGDVFEGEEGSEYQDEPPETTHEGNEMDVDTTSTHITTVQAHYLLKA
ncbi:hypothetical protein EV368DRAFT_65568 [Lentinula lateritia]|uniref:Uncharacterized protein n=1 Tax=Lentinula aff. lateritia TaxID=2804960 RepID=A0ACC1TY01_9AGAR|nr:hypothetical protein F5876DRAFT_66269 [Lentinula aff. lateritia]KAJ3851674.1 hypothetical protein EV368DRAFT_65568 [Lentinula lateritia]